MAAGGIEGEQQIRFGIDFGGVICGGPARSGEERSKEEQEGERNEDTKGFFGDRYLEVPEIADSIATIAMIVAQFGADNVFIVSKAGANTRRKTVEWLHHRDFFTRTGGFLEEHVLFCDERWQKEGLVSSRLITHFVDDHPENIRGVSAAPSMRLTFHLVPKPQPLRRFRGVACLSVTSWLQIRQLFLELPRSEQLALHPREPYHPRPHHHHDRRGDRPAATSSSPSDSLICRHFLKGRCSFGDRCRYLHQKL